MILTAGCGGGDRYSSEPSGNEPPGQPGGGGDPDDPGTAASLVVSTRELRVAEAGGAGTYTVALSAQPSEEVTVSVASGDITAATVSPSSLAFTGGNWETAQTVTITGVDDEIVNDPARTVTITHSATGYGDATVAVTVTDDDSAPADAPTGLTVTATSANSISLSWTAPAEDGGRTIEAYNVNRCTEGRSPCALGPDHWIAWVTDGTAFTDTHDDSSAAEAGGTSRVARGSTYHYAVAVYWRGTGVGDWSGEVIPAGQVNVLFPTYVEADPDLRTCNGYASREGEAPVHLADAHPDSPIERWSPEHYNLLEDAYRLLASTGQKAITATVKDGAFGAPGMVAWTRTSESGDDWRFDFSAFGTHVETLMHWGIDQRIDAYGIIGWNRDEIPYWSEELQAARVLDAPPGSAAHAAAWRPFLRAFRTYLDGRGWFDRTYLAVDERPDELEMVIELIRGDHPDWKIGLAYTDAYLPEALRREVDVANVFIGGAHVAGPAIRAGQIRTFYTACYLDPTNPVTRVNSLLAPDTNPADVEWLAWYAGQLGMDGYSRWAYDYWRTADPLDMRSGLAHTSGDGSLIYRTSNDSDLEAMTSVRLPNRNRTSAAGSNPGRTASPIRDGPDHMASKYEDLDGIGLTSGCRHPHVDSDSEKCCINCLTSAHM